MKNFQINVPLARPQGPADAESGLMLSIAAIVEKYGSRIYGTKECDVTEEQVKACAGKVLQIESLADDNGVVQTMTFKVINANKAVN